MEKINFLVAIATFILAIGHLAEAQQQKKIPRVGILFMGGRDQPHLEAFKQGLRDLGYSEGKTSTWNIATPKGNTIGS